MNATEFLAKAAKQYSLMVATERQIPSVTDGLKDTQRIAAWIMRNRSKTKVSAISGAMSESNLFYGGNADGVISGMAGPYTNNVPVLTGDGNFGSLLNPTAYGAGRYVYATRSKYMEDIIMADKELWEMVPSIDGDTEMCKNFLPLIPNVIVNGGTGVAVGWSTEILSHDPKDVLKAVSDRLQGKKTKKLMPKFLAYPDVDIKEIENGRDDADSYIISGVVKIVNTSTVEITALPPDLSVEKVQETLNKLEESKAIASYENHTSNKVRFIIKMQRADLAKHTEESLIKLFKISARVTQRLVVVDFCGTKIRVFNNTDELIDAWVAWRFPFFKIRYEKQLEKLNNEISFLEAIVRLADEEFPKRISAFPSRTAMVKHVKSAVKIPDDDVSKIVSLPSYRWSIEEIEKTKALLSEKYKLQSETIDIIFSEEKQKDIWISELKSLKF